MSSRLTSFSTRSSILPLSSLLSVTRINGLAPAGKRSTIGLKYHPVVRIREVRWLHALHDLRYCLVRNHEDTTTGSSFWHSLLTLFPLALLNSQKHTQRKSQPPMPTNRHPTPSRTESRLRSTLDGCGSMDGRLNLTNRSPQIGHLLPFSVSDTFPHAHL